MLEDNHWGNFFTTSQVIATKSQRRSTLSTYKAAYIYLDELLNAHIGHEKHSWRGVLNNEQASLHVHAYLLYILMGWPVFGDKLWRLYCTQRALAPLSHIIHNYMEKPTAPCSSIHQLFLTYSRSKSFWDLYKSVPDPWHFGVDPDPDLRIHAFD
jgi:hypothetical protein